MWESPTLVNENYKKKPEQFVDRLYEMGLNRKLDIGIRGEGKPDIKYTDSELWSGLSLPWMSIGYEVRMTPSADSGILQCNCQ